MRSILEAGVAVGVIGILSACGGAYTPSSVRAPGANKTPETGTLEAGADALQLKEPLESLNTYLDGFHFYSGNMQGQMETHHYCALINEEVTQCVIFDGNAKDAKLMGVEYIISARLFSSLQPDEKHLWHSHVHEVRSGQLIAPGIPQAAETRLMEKLAGTYGKTWHTWHTDQHQTLPLGTPMLMMGFTRDGQADQGMVTLRDERFSLKSVDKRDARASIHYPAVDPDADAWQKGIILQLQVSKQAPGHAQGPTADDQGKP